MKVWICFACLIATFSGLQAYDMLVGNVSNYHLNVNIIFSVWATALIYAVYSLIKRFKDEKE
jgi:hypothetical protein